MNAADWIILAVIAVSIAQAAMEGFFHQAFAIAGLIIGYVLAAWRYRTVADWLAPHVKSAWLSDMAGFLLIFIGIVIVAGIMGRFARWIVKEAGLSFFDRILGGALGAVRGALTVAIVLVSMTAFTPTSKLLEGSSLAPYFQVFGRAATWIAPSELRARFYQGLDLLRQERNAAATSDAKAPPR